ncbi:MAG: hypothetical protein AAF416_06915 [Pseudomonadota bacterium]
MERADSFQFLPSDPGRRHGGADESGGLPLKIEGPELTARGTDVPIDDMTLCTETLEFYDDP